MIKNLIILSLGLCLAFVFTSNKPAETNNYFVVHYTIGKNWKKGKDFPEQAYSKNHSRHLDTLKKNGIIILGMRYGDKGMVCIKAKTVEEAKKIINSDSAVILKTFNTEIQEADVFYDGCLNTEPEPENRKATGIGGIFFKAKDVKALKEWYYKNLGFVHNDYGTMFEFRDGVEPNKKGYTQWSPFNEKTKYFEPSQKEFMINYRVNNLEKLKTELEKNQVQILDKIETYEYGKFLHIMDIEGNKIELWEPLDTEFTRLYDKKTTR